MTPVQFLEHFGTAIGAGVVFLIVVVFRLATSKHHIRRGLNTVVLFLALFFVLRLALVFVPAEMLVEDGHASLLAKILTAVGLGLMILAGARLLPIAFFDYFLERDGTRAPRILRDVTIAALYVVAGITIIGSVFPGVNLSSLVATAGVASLVLGLALQDTLGNVFAGLALQAERPFEPGDWITVGETTGRVTEVDWRAVKVINWDRDVLVIPNSVIGRERFINHSRPRSTTGCSIEVAVSYDIPPTEVVETLMRVVTTTDGVRPEPEPWVRLVDFDESAATYKIRFYAAAITERYGLEHQVRVNAWYALHRKGIPIQLPVRNIRTLPEPTPEPPDVRLQSIADALSQIRFLRDVETDALMQLASGCRRETYGAGETIIREGERGSDCYLVVDGELRVLLANGGPPSEIATLGPGNHFGEISALSGEPRTSTVIAATDVTTVVVDGPSLKQLLKAHPDTAEALGRELENRRQEIEQRSVEPDTDGAARPPAGGQILKRLKQLLGL